MEDEEEEEEEEVRPRSGLKWLANLFYLLGYTFLQWNCKNESNAFFSDKGIYLYFNCQ